MPRVEYDQRWFWTVREVVSSGGHMGPRVLLELYLPLRLKSQWAGIAGQVSEYADCP